jgi:hypothetical protein
MSSNITNNITNNILPKEVNNLYNLNQIVIFIKSIEDIELQLLDCNYIDHKHILSYVKEYLNSIISNTIMLKDGIGVTKINTHYLYTFISESTNKDLEKFININKNIVNIIDFLPTLYTNDYYNNDYNNHDVKVNFVINILNNLKHKFEVLIDCIKHNINQS